QGIVADYRDYLCQAGFAQCRDRLVEGGVREAPRLEQICADAIDERFVLQFETRRVAAADRLNRGCRDAGLLGERCMCVPLVLRTPELGSRDDRQLGKTIGQRGAPRKCSPSFAAYSQISGARISS